MDKPTCKTCPYFEPLGRAESFGDGECRKGRPRFNIKSAESDNFILNRGFFPDVFEDEWCGEHPDFPAWLANWRERPQ